MLLLVIQWRKKSIKFEGGRVSERQIDEEKEETVTEFSWFFFSFCWILPNYHEWKSALEKMWSAEKNTENRIAQNEFLA